MLKNKLHTLIVLFLIMCAPMVSAQTYSEEEAPFNEKEEVIRDVCGERVRPIRVAGFVTNPPLGWADIISRDERRTNGFGLKFFEQLAKDENLHVRNLAYTSYQEAVAAVKSNKADILLGIYYNPQLLDGLKLIYPSYTSNPFIVLFKKGNERPVKSFEDLAGLKGVVRQEELVYPLIFNILPAGVSMTQISGAKNAFTGLIDGTYDYMLTSLYNAETELRRFKLIDDIVMTERPLTQPQLFFAMGANSPCAFLKDRIESKLRTMKADQKTLQKMLIAEIDAWGERFAKDPSLIEMLQAEKDAATAAESGVQPPDENPTETADTVQNPDESALTAASDTVSAETGKAQSDKPKIILKPVAVQQNSLTQAPNA